MNYAAYGLGQGLSQGMNNNQLVNAFNTASLIQYRRDQQRLQNRYVDLKQQQLDLDTEKWGMEQQAMQQALDEQAFKFEQLQKQTEGKEAANLLYWAVKSQDARTLNNFIQQSKYVKPLADNFGANSFSFTHQFSPEELRNIGLSEGMNPRDYIVSNNLDGTRTLIKARDLMGILGVGNQFTQEQIDDAFRTQQLSRLEQVGVSQATPEGIANAENLARLQRSAETIYDARVNTKGNVSDFRTAEMKNLEAQDDHYRIAIDMNLPEQERMSSLRRIKNSEQSAAAASANYRQFSQEFNASSPDAIRQAINNSSLSPEEKQRKLSDLDYMIRLVKNRVSKIESETVKNTITETSKFVTPIFNATKNLTNLITSAESGDKNSIQKVNSVVARVLSFLPDKAMSSEAIKEIEKESDFTMITAKMLQYVSGLTTNMQDTKNNINRFGDIKKQNPVPVMVGLRSLLDEFMAKQESLQSFLNPEEYSIIFGGASYERMAELRDLLDSKINEAKGIIQPNNAQTTPKPTTLTPEQSAYLDNMLMGGNQ